MCQRLIVNLGPDRHPGIEQLGEAGRDRCAVLQPFIGQRPDNLEAHYLILRFAEPMMLGRDGQFGHYCALAFEGCPRRVESRRGRRLSFVPNIGAVEAETWRLLWHTEVA